METCARPLCSLPKMPGWFGEPLFLGRREFPADLPAENWLARMCIW